LGQGLEFQEVGAEEYPPGELERWTKMLGTMTGIRGIRHSVEGGRRMSVLFCKYAPAVVQASNVQMLLVDQKDPAGGTIAEHLRIPFISICTSLPLNREPAVPPPFVPWNYQDSRASRLRNWFGYCAADLAIAPLHNQINDIRHRWKLPLLRTPDDSFSRLATISQTVAEFDFPRKHLPENFHAVGPFVDQHLDEVPFDWARLDGRPLIYASLGTLQTRREELYRAMASACADLSVQLVISFGGAEPPSAHDWPGAPILVKYAPQMLLLKRARMMITHAGLNTVLHCLSLGVPMVAMPITNDQPAIAARARYTGAAEVLVPSRFSPRLLAESVKRVLSNTTYRTAAERVSDAMKKAGGVARGAAIIEAVAVKHCVRPISSSIPCPSPSPMEATHV
jgi:zeaxanthin glucosyltransferase